MRRRHVLLALGATGALLYGSVRLLRARRRRLGGLDSAVSFSACTVAAARAVESARSDGLFYDPFAACFAGDEAMRRVARKGKKLDTRIAVRTRFFDDAILDALRRTPGAQVVLLGAGLDARAWRLSPPGGLDKCATLIEVDRQDVLGAKGALLAALPGGLPRLTLSKKYVGVACNLQRHDWFWHLKSAGHEPGVPTVWVLEGLLYYLPPATVDAVLRTVARLSAPGSSLVASCVNTAAMVRAQTNGKSEAMRSFQSAVDDPAAYFQARGWHVLKAARPGDPECSYGRFPAPEHPAADGMPATWYVVATRSEVEGAEQVK